MEFEELGDNFPNFIESMRTGILTKYTSQNGSITEEDKKTILNKTETMPTNTEKGAMEKVNKWIQDQMTPEGNGSQPLGSSGKGDQAPPGLGRGETETGELKATKAF